MNSFALPFAMLCGLALAAMAMSLFSLLWMQRAVRAAAHCAEARLMESATAVENIRNELQSCARQLHEIRQEPPRAAASGGAGPALNLSKRSQALRMHRRGDEPEAIASTLGVPLQEIELLLKVHRIVIAAL